MLVQRNLIRNPTIEGPLQLFQKKSARAASGEKSPESPYVEPAEANQHEDLRNARIHSATNSF